MPTIADKRRAFRKLHETGCFVIPNPWDIGSARYLQHLGFKALATTSAGFAFTRALPDGGAPRDMMLAHIREIVEATDLPVNADFGEGFAHDPAGVAESVRMCGETGVAGLSVEDATGDGGEPLYDLDTAVERMRSARAAIRRWSGRSRMAQRRTATGEAWCRPEWASSPPSSHPSRSSRASRFASIVFRAESASNQASDWRMP